MNVTGTATRYARILTRTPVLVSALTLLAARAAAQQSAEQPVELLARRPLATRDTLEALAQRLQRGDGADHDAELLAAVRARLREGDFEPGDAIWLAVQGESTLSDTFTVNRDRSVVLPPPTVGSLSLAGVLRSELEPTVERYLAQFVKQPVVQARSLMRLSIQGEVARAGFYQVPADALLGDALMAAGGANANADLRKLRVERDGKTIWEGAELRRAIAGGYSLDRADLQDGDRFIVGSRRQAGIQDSLRFLWVIVSLAGGVYGLSRAIP